jgi:hypothetical protein
MDAEKIAMAVIAVAMVTTLILPGRQTAQVGGALTNLSTKTLGTAMGTFTPKPGVAA